MKQEHLLNEIYSYTLMIEGVKETNYERETEVEYLEEIKNKALELILRNKQTTIDNSIRVIEADNDLIAIMYTSEFLGAIVVYEKGKREKEALFSIVDDSAYRKVFDLISRYEKSPF
ncbi:hypothetical protein [Pseudomonas sp. MF6747]|uniref:hypothetical protein n=1 Tax=Pseudomonas sp. MF6747 TaxID=2797527 RepID=UPI00190BDC14|nr:hypothetical protein [Pseudomonas sp. MF6747]MBK3509411.1 hypothetical protein [Pseudomonas sp. MF6747]